MTSAPEGLSTVGLYAFRPAPAFYPFWKACGYNLLQFIDHAFSLPPEAREEAYAHLARGIEEAHQAGFKVDIIQLSNISSWPDYPSPSVFDPLDEAAMGARLEAIHRGVQLLSEADSFTFFAGDPGGAPNPLGVEGVLLWKRMTDAVRQLVRHTAPHAEFNANLWAVTAWEDHANSAFKAPFWKKETLFHRLLVEEAGLGGPDCGLQFPLHNYYRSLVFKAFDEIGEVPEPYPLAEDIERLRERGVTRLWGWAHFLIDEVDDGYTGYAGKVHPAQAETRYLHRIASQARSIGLDGLISNTDSKDAYLEQTNLYAFARCCHDESANPEGVITEFAAQLAEAGSAGDLARVLSFIENHSTWEASLPPQYRLPAFEGTGFADASEALATLEKVEPRQRPDIPLAEPPAAYLARLGERLRDLVRT